MPKFYQLVCLAVIVICWTACVPPQKPEVMTNINIDVTDSLFQTIANEQDLRQPEKLYTLLYHPDPTYRYLSTRAFASIIEPTAIDSIARLLNDPVDEVRAMAAFALGQTKSEEALPFLIEGFIDDTTHVFRQTQRAILEAVGKCGDEETLAFLSSVTTYTVQDTALLEGQALGIYRFGQRGLTEPMATKRMLAMVGNDYPTSVNAIAAGYLAYMPVNLDSTAVKPLIQSFESSNDPNIKMTLAIALGKTKRNEALTSLVGQYEKERDYRTKCNILRALSNFPYENGKTLVAEALRDDNEHVARRATQYLLENSTLEDAAQWWRFAKDSLPTPINIELYRVANRHIPAYRVEFRNAINAELRAQYQKTNEAHKKGDILQALAEFAWNYRFVYHESQVAEQEYVRTAALEALQLISEKPDFDTFFRLSAKRVRRELATCFVEAIRTKEAGAVATAALALRSEAFNYRPLIDSINVLEEVLEDLPLPTMVESYNELGLTINHLKGNDKFEPITPEYNHTINWALLNKHGNRPQLKMETEKGAFTLELWGDIAPASVINLLTLASEGFLEGKTFHRVVPNFVIQGGSPSGDSYGSPDYTIRSELSDKKFDEEGMLGMASAGKDTESSQFFITHSPTMFLDADYTLFGRVVEGMDIVHSIHAGDRIKSAAITK